MYHADYAAVCGVTLQIINRGCWLEFCVLGSFAWSIVTILFQRTAKRISPILLLSFVVVGCEQEWKHTYFIFASVQFEWSVSPLVQVPI